MVGLWPHRAFTFRLVVALPLEQHSSRFASVIDPLGIARLNGRKLSRVKNGAIGQGHIRLKTVPPGNWNDVGRGGVDFVGSIWFTRGCP